MALILQLEDFVTSDKKAAIATLDGGWIQVAIGDIHNSLGRQPREARIRGKQEKLQTDISPYCQMRHYCCIPLNKEGPELQRARHCCPRRVFLSLLQHVFPGLRIYYQTDYSGIAVAVLETAARGCQRRAVIAHGIGAIGMRYRYCS